MAMLPNATFYPSADPVDCEACGLPIGPVARVISAGGDPNQNYLVLLVRDPKTHKLRKHRLGDERHLEIAYAICTTCSKKPKKTLPARVFSHKARGGQY